MHTPPEDKPLPTRWFKAGQVSRSPNLIFRAMIGLLIATSFYLIGWKNLAYIGAGLTITLSTIAMTSTSGALFLERTFSKLGALLGTSLAALTLTPIYLIIFPLIRVYDWVTGVDPMGKQRSMAFQSYWSPADHPSRVKAGVKRSFVTEPLLVRRQNGLSGLIVLALIGLVLSEVSLRMLGFGDPVLYIEDARFGYLPAPDQNVMRDGHEISVNQWGMRAPQITSDKPDHVTRVLLLGDSTLWGGSYTPQDEIYARQLEQKINRHTRPDESVQILNVGVNGWGPEHKLGYLETYGHFDADLAVVALPYADLMRPISYLSMTPFYPAKHPPMFALQEVIYHLSWRWRGQLIGRISQEQRKIRLNRGVKAYIRLAQALLARGMEVRFEILPSRTAVEGTISPKEVAMVRQLRTALQNLSSPLDLHFAPEELALAYHDQPEDFTIYHDYGHLNPRGHGVYAQHLAERLSQSPHIAKILKSKIKESPSQTPRRPSPQPDTQRSVP